LVFTISAIFHEYVVLYQFRFFFPFLFFSFGILGVTFVFATRGIKSAFGNFFMWFTLALGQGTVLSMYHMEYYARQNCPDYDAPFYVPALYKCINFHF
jgi:sterol O-acyltransferase